MIRKKNKKKKRIFLIYLAIIALIMCGTQTEVHAEEAMPEGKGSIALILQKTDEEGNSIPYKNIEVYLYRIGNARHDGSQGFDLDEAYSATGVNIQKLETASDIAEAAKKLASEARKSEEKGQKLISDESGKIYFRDLEQGIYLVDQVDQSGQIRMSPMLLTLPMSEDGEWNLNVSAYPKMSESPEEPPTPDESSSPKEPDNKKMVRTGDLTNLILWVVLAASAVLAIIVIVLTHKKRNNFVKDNK